MRAGVVSWKSKQPQASGKSRRREKTLFERWAEGMSVRELWRGDATAATPRTEPLGMCSFSRVRRKLHPRSTVVRNWVEVESAVSEMVVKLSP